MRLWVLRRARLGQPDGTVAATESDVAVEAGHIAWVRPSTSELPEGAVVCDGRGRVLLPGFVDMHVHLARYREFLPDMLRWGITGIREAGNPFPAVRALRDVPADQRPAVSSAGPLVDGDPPRWPALSVIVRSVEDVQAVVGRHREAGVEWVKAYHRLPPDLLAALIREAHRHGLHVMGHLGQVPWRTALAWGIDSLEHVRLGPVDGLVPRRFAAEVAATPWPMKDFRFWACVNLQSDRLRRLLDEMARRGVLWTPTLTVLAVAWARPPGERFMPRWIRMRWQAKSYRLRDPASRRQARAVWPRILRLVAMAHGAGVRIFVGTDTPNVHTPPGWSFHWELRWLERAGVPLRDIVQMACWRPYEALAWPRPFRPGSPADFVLLATTALRSVRDLRRIRRVVRAGRTVFLHPAEAGTGVEDIEGPF
jgi:imidazolonepropionase-like amidohydrolase